MSASLTATMSGANQDAKGGGPICLGGTFMSHEVLEVGEEAQRTHAGGNVEVA
jgi:hypothetical protein